MVQDTTTYSKVSADPVQPVRETASDGATPRVQRVDTADGSVIVKRRRPPHGRAAYRLLNWVATLIGMPALRAAPILDAAYAEATERRRLAELAAAGVPVPAVLDNGEEGLVLQDLGTRDLTMAIRDDAAHAVLHWQAGVTAIAALHARGQYLSQAFARNLLLRDGKIYFIDFEDDPLEVMSLPHAQLRDWLCFLHSTEWLLASDPAERVAYFERALADTDPHGLSALRKFASRLSWLRHLPQRRSTWGRDVVSLRGLGHFCHALKSRRH